MRSRPPGAKLLQSRDERHARHRIHIMVPGLAPVLVGEVPDRLLVQLRDFQCRIDWDALFSSHPELWGEDELSLREGFSSR